MANPLNRRRPDVQDVCRPALQAAGPAPLPLSLTLPFRRRERPLKGAVGPFFGVCLGSWPPDLPLLQHLGLKTEGSSPAGVSAPLGEVAGGGQCQV